MVRPSRISAGNWKHSDLPLPVGITASTSRPARIVSMISPWPARNAAKPNTVRRRLWAAARSGMGDGYHRSSTHVNKDESLRPLELVQILHLLRRASGYCRDGRSGQSPQRPLFSFLKRRDVLMSATRGCHLTKIAYD